MANLNEQVDTLFTTIEPIIVSEEPLKEKPLLKKITSDISTGVREFPTQVAGGFVDAINETGNAIEDLVKYVGGDDYKAFQISDFETYEEPETVTGSLIRGITQFTTGFIGAGKITKPIKVIRKAGGFTKASLHGAMADAVIFDPQEGRLADLIESNPSLQNPVTTYLKSDPNDSRAEGRFKNAIEGFGLGFAIEGLFRTVKILKKRKNMDIEFEKLAPNIQADILKEHKGMQTLYMTKDKLPVEKYPWEYGEITTTKSGRSEVKLINPVNKESIIDMTHDLRPIAWGKHYRYEIGPYNVIRHEDYTGAIRESTAQTDAITGRHTKSMGSRTYWDVAPGFRKPLTNKQYTFLLNEYIKKGNAEFDKILLAGDKDKQILPWLDDLFKSETKTQKVTLEGIRVPESLKTEWGTISKAHISEFNTRLAREVKDVGNEFLVNMATARLVKQPVKISDKPLLDIQHRPKAEVGPPKSEGISSSPLYKSSLTLLKKIHQKTPLVSTSIEDIKSYAKKMGRTKEETNELIKEIKAQNIATIESKELVPITRNISISQQRLSKIPSVKEYIDTNKSKIVENRTYKKVDQKFDNVAAYIDEFHLGDPNIDLKHGHTPKLPAMLETEYMPFTIKELKTQGYGGAAFDMSKFVDQINSMGIEQKMVFAQKAFDFLRRTWIQGPASGISGMRYVKGMPKELSNALEEVVFQAQFSRYIIDEYHGLAKNLPVDIKKGIPLEEHMTERVLSKLMKSSIIDMDYRQASGPKGINVFDYPILIPHGKKYQGLRENARVAQKLGKQIAPYRKYMKQRWKFEDF